MRFIDFVILLSLFAVLGAGMYFLWLNFPTQNIEFEEFHANISQRFPSSSSQFYPNMRYPESNISYKISDGCSQKKRKDFIRATASLEEKTILSFFPSPDGEISVVCSNIAPEPNEEGHFIAGEGGPSFIINSSKYAIITIGKIALYRTENCDEPHIALHEILHALGFNHNSNKTSVLYPITNCEQILDQYIIDELNALYSQPPAADLLIESASANKSGRYLNFEITMVNYGLKKVNNFTLEIISEGQTLENLYVGDLDLGAKRHLSVSNLRIPRSTVEISFVVKTSELEITKENNEARIALVGV